MDTNFISEPVYPTKIVDASLGTKNEEVLLKHKTLAIALTNSSCFLLPPKGHITLDFGKEYSGGLRLLVHSHTSKKGNHAKIRIRLGESLGETMVDVGYKGATNDHSPRDMVEEVVALSDHTFGESGFRFARIDNLEDEAEIYFDAIVLSFHHLSEHLIGSFKCDDPLINEIFDTSLRTASMCVQNGLIYDGIKRDRLVWCGDMGIEIRTLLETYGKIAPIADSLRFCKDNYPLPGWINNIPSYSFWWIINAKTYLSMADDEEFLTETIAYLEPLLKQISTIITDEGSLSFPNDDDPDNMNYFIDWPSAHTEDAKVATMALLYLALSDAAFLLKKGNKDSRSPLELRNKLVPTILSEEATKGIMALCDFSFGSNHSEQIVRGGGKRVSTFMSYFIFKALGKANRYEDSLSIMKDCYGSMLKAGATTFFEDYDMSWEKDGHIDSLPVNGKRYMHADNGAYCYKGYRMSLCHGWAAGPVPYLLEDIAGVSFLDPTHVMIDPHPCYLKTIDATIQTIMGPLSIHVEDGKMSYSAPKGIAVKSK